MKKLFYRMGLPHAQICDVSLGDKIFSLIELGGKSIRWHFSHRHIGECPGVTLDSLGLIALHRTAIGIRGSTAARAVSPLRGWRWMAFELLLGPIGDGIGELA